jgi:antitoxin VapB
MRRDEKKQPAPARHDKTERGLAYEILEIGKRCAALPDLHQRSAEEILGYDKHGLPR